MNAQNNTRNIELNNSIEIEIKAADLINSVVNTIKNVSKAGIKEALNIAERGKVQR